MADDFTEVSTQSYFSRLGGSIVGVLFGFLLLPASVILLYWNEGRAVDALQALDRGAKQVVEVAADRLDPSADSKLVHLTGAMAVGTPARDPLFGITGSGLVRLDRAVQMYQWTEEKHSESHESIGGSKTTETTYSYRQDWSSQPINSAQFKHPEGHVNPAMPVRGQTFDGGNVTLGAYRLGGPVLEKITDFEPLAPDASAAPPDGYRREGDGFFRGAGSAGSPAVGDLKISFTAIAAQPVSVVAGLSGGTLAAFHDPSGYPIIMAQPGVASAETLFSAKKHEENIWTWILRGAGTVAMLIGFLLIARPISMALAFLPFLEGIAETGAFLVALTLTLPLALLTIAIAWIAHRPLIGGPLIIGAIALFVLFRQMHRRPAAAPAR
jgi:hypothetical protein